jgi:hypothetical protein
VPLVLDLRIGSKFRDFSENRSVLFPFALVTVRLHGVHIGGIGVIDPDFRQN